MPFTPGESFARNLDSKPTMETKVNNLEKKNEEVRPVAGELAREISADELKAINVGGAGTTLGDTTDKVK